MNLAALTDEQLFDVAAIAIRQAAAGESRGGGDLSYQHAMAVMNESDRRVVAAGHAEHCGASIYQRAYEQVTAEHAYRTPDPQGCTCGADR